MLPPRPTISKRRKNAGVMISFSTWLGLLPSGTPLAYFPSVLESCLSEKLLHHRYVDYQGFHSLVNGDSNAIVCLL